MSQMKRQRNPSRNTSPTRQKKTLILIIHEGEKTEPDYLTGLKQVCRNCGVHLEVVKSDGNPENYVNKAIQVRETKKAEFDEIWCVFDQDHHASHQLIMAKSLAESNDIKLAISIPCIEVWLYLHFNDNPGSGTCNDIRQKLRKYVRNYDKSVDFAKHYKNGYHEAVNRSVSRLKSAEADNDLWRNPSTHMHLLCESIRGDSEFQA